jgi:hypothetical protein
MKKLTFLFLIIVVLVQLSNFVFGVIPAEERAALIALYNSTNGDGWRRNSHWKTPPLDTDGFAMPGTEENWYGLDISGNHVVALDMSNNYLTGSLPPELGNLSCLEYIYVGGTSNRLSGGIPSQLGNLSHLRFLELGYNQLSGSIPSELGNLSQLAYLNLENNQLIGSIPSELGSLSNMKTLDLNYNLLSGVIPLSFINLTKITDLDIGYNCLSATDTALRLWLSMYDSDWEISQCLEKVPPFGEFASPINGSTVSSSIAVTGWALDVYGMDSVKIYFKQKSVLIFIGDGIFIEGARPDVEIAYPGYPGNNKAGWGYILLTNLLPNGGNGTYTLIAKATDMEGNEATLGSKTITIDNAHAVKPFGAIDTPAQGGTASGEEFVNFGWALTPQPNTIPVDGSTIDVVIDGVVKGHPVYNKFRSDIATLFPGYANTDGAIGYYYIDTTKLTNGVHTISWNVTDSGGNSDGIGSRYFSIMNTGTSSDSDLFLQDRKFKTADELNPDECDFTHFEIKELERIKLPVAGCRLPVEEEAQGAFNTLKGYMVVGNELRELPIGSTLDKEKGVFYWQPGPGFVGEYRFLFIGKDENGQFTKKNIIVNIKPKH